MKKIVIIGLISAMICSLPAFSGAQSSPYDKYLTISDIQDAGKLTGVKIVPYDPSKGAGGNLNFALQDGTLVLMATFQTLQPKDYEKVKAQMKSSIKGLVPGIGDDAFIGPPNDPQYFIEFKKGTRVVSLSTFFNMAKLGQTFLNIDQLCALAKVVAGRL
jgi:hypothetical protein